MSIKPNSVRPSGMRTLLTRGLLGVAVLATAGACSNDLTVPNYQNATPESIQGDPVSAVPLLASGILRNDRDNATTYMLALGILGREAYNYTPTEGRNTTGYLSPEVNTPSSFAATSGSLWANQYTGLRNVANLIGTLEGAATGIFTDARKSAGLGFAHTMEGLLLGNVIASRYNLGAPVDIKADPAVISPFVSRDSVYRHIVGRLDQGKTELLAGGTSFPFTLHSGYAGFTTPANYLKFNRALAARYNAYRASIGASGCGAARSATCYQTVLTNLSESFIDPAGSLTTGAFNVYSSAASDVANGLSNQSNSSVVAHAKADSGIQLKADGTRDNRFLTKVITITEKKPSNALHGVGSTFDYTMYSVRESPVPIIRNEELILLRAEARYFTGDLVGALEDINTIRTRAGGLPALVVPFANETAFIDELLYNRRLSLVFEGHRWVDMRRFGRLNLLTKDLPTHVIVSELPIPQAECLSRAQQTEPALKGPGC
jgi:starch-binding outer membrane protein, SusD/RagB family